MEQTTLIPKPYSQREFIDNTKNSQKVIVNAQSSIVNITNILRERTEKREKIFSNIIDSKKRREFLSRRQELEEELESKNIIRAPNIGGIVRLASRSGKGLIDRIVSSLGYLAAGWILRNLPTWTGMAKEFIARLQEAGRIIKSFVTGAINVFQSSFRLISGAIENLKNFDLFDSSNKVRGSFDELVQSINTMGSEIEAGVKLITTPLTQTTEDGRQVGSYSGQEVPALGSTSSDMGAYGDSSPSSGSSSNRAVYGTKGQKALLDAIAFAEGNTSWSTWAGYQKHGPDDLTGLTIGQVHDLQTSFMRAGKTRKTGSAVVGRYQFKDLLYHAKNAGLNPETDKFSPANQDRMAIKASERRGVTADMLAKEGLSTRVADLLAPEWASFPYSPKGGRSYYGQGFKDIKTLQSVYNKSLGSASQTSSPQTSSTSSRLSPLTGTSGTVAYSGREGTTLSTPLSPLLPEARGVITSGKGYRRSTQSYHKGYDIGADTGTPVYSYFPGIVTRIVENGRGDGGYGHSIEWKDSIHGQTHFFAHLQKRPSLSVGQKFDTHTKLGYVGGTGQGIQNKYDPHLHWEIGPRGSEVDPGQWLRNIGVKPKDSSSILSQQIPQPQQAQISQTPTQQRQQISQTLTPERKAQDIIAIIGDQQGESTPQVMMQPVSSGMKSGPSMTTVLNNFMKQKLLLELAYV